RNPVKEHTRIGSTLSIISQIGLLWKALKSLKSLKTLSLTWESYLNWVIRGTTIERIVSHVSEMGLMGFTLEETAWMGINLY
ncbi:hypothetical protein BGZ65_003771, partial [Modicella reniformis]